VAGLDVIVIGVEVQVFAEQAVDARIVAVGAHALAQRTEVVLVHDLVGLQVESPVAGACVERDVGLHGVAGAAHELRLVPDRFDDAELGVVDAGAGAPSCRRLNRPPP
jgi:hypothetical protein